MKATHRSWTSGLVPSCHRAEETLQSGAQASVGHRRFRQPSPRGGALGYPRKVGRGGWREWKRTDGSGGWLGLSCHLQLMPWTDESRRPSGTAQNRSECPPLSAPLYSTLVCAQGFGAHPSPDCCYSSFSLVPHSPQLTCRLWGGRGRTVPATPFCLFWSQQGSLADKVASLSPHPPAVCYLLSAPPGEPTLAASRGLAPRLSATAA